MMKKLLRFVELIFLIDENFYSRLFEGESCDVQNYRHRRKINFYFLFAGFISVIDVSYRNPFVAAAVGAQMPDAGK